jgi:hypothetical protein
MAAKKKSAKKKNLGGRPITEVGKLAKKEGISRSAAWWRLNRGQGYPKRGRPKKVEN